MNNIKIITTGGTFDKEYNELDGSLYFKDTHIPEMLELGRSRLKLSIEKIMMIDSLDMVYKDRKKILDYCQSIEEKKIVITHGTDTMAETASLLSKNIKDKTIVMTGAMIPYKFGSSDGLFNLGSALSFVQTLPTGVYIATNGKYFRADNVRKNKKLGIFEKIK